MTASRSATATKKTPALSRDILDAFARSGAMTSPGSHTSLFDPLPKDVSGLSEIVQGLNIHEYMASAYGFTVPEERKSETQIRSLEKMLELLLALDDRPLTEARPPEKRLVGVCNHFAVFMVGALRAKGVPARARWGFGSYFNPPFFEDHVLTEYWNPSGARWIRVDAQLAPVYQQAMKLDFGILDVPHDRFVIAGDAWAQCRAGQADPSKYGIFQGNLRGLWFIAGSLVKDLAALNRIEMLPWDVWGAMPKPGTRLSEDQLEFFDRLAALTREPDGWFDEIRDLYEGDDRVRIPATVFNALLQRTEPI
jgi:hypothetical protein